MALVFTTFALLICAQVSNGTPVRNTSLVDHEPVLNGRGEINPVSPKFTTTPDPGMPPPVDFNVMSKRNLSWWDDEELVLTSEIFLPGQFQARVPIANGYVWSYFILLGLYLDTLGK
jgi:hypothetical protein